MHERVKRFKAGRASVTDECGSGCPSVSKNFDQGRRTYRVSTSGGNRGHRLDTVMFVRVEYPNKQSVETWLCENPNRWLSNDRSVSPYRETMSKSCICIYSSSV